MANPFSLKPALATAFETAGSLGQLGALREQRKLTAQKAEQGRMLGEARQVASQALGGTPEAKQSALKGVAKFSVKEANEFRAMYDSANKTQKAEVESNIDMMGASAAQVLTLAPEMRTQGIMAMGEQFLAAGNEALAERTMAFANMEMTPEDRDLNLKAMVAQSQESKDIISLTKIKEAAEEKFSPMSKVLDDNTIVQLTDSGKIFVTDSSGKRLTGEARAVALKKATEAGIDIQGRRSGSREAAKAAVKASTEAFNKIAPLRANVLNLREGIRLIDEGAGTGPVESMFKSFKAASVQLENLQKKLGLDVVGSATFGALSEGELQLALDIAMPTNLDEAELKIWLTERADAQEKVIAVFEEAAIFLGTPGNGIADYVKMKKFQNRNKKPESAADMSDAELDRLIREKEGQNR